ncbi:MAG TPA: hypothetical protein VHV83_14855 [Armatimonadota bacterium]|nr:hypothetical protein [Armatimonadota bacterium]
MLTFDTDHVLMGELPDGISNDVLAVSRDVAEAHLHDEMCTFFVPESAADLIDSGPISTPVCCGENVAAAITKSKYRTQRHESPDGTTNWVAPVTVSNYRADVLRIPESEWLPDDIRHALTPGGSPRWHAASR